MKCVVCETDEQVREAQRLRYEVYCVEKGWVDTHTAEAIEIDPFDPLAVHFLAYDDEGVPIGTARLLLGSRQQLPATRFLPQAAAYAPEETVEISRLAARRQSRSHDAAVLLGLLRAMWEWAMERSITNCVAVADAPLFALLKRMGMPIVASGPKVEYVGSTCVPAALDIASVGPVLDARGF